MNKKALQVLEYDKIINMLRQCASCDMSRQIIDELKPICDIDQIRSELRLTSEGVDLIVRKGPLPLGSIYDIAGSANLARKEGNLTIRQLMHIGYNLRVTRDVISFMKGETPEVPGILAMVEVLEPLQKLQEKIDRCIISEDEISDNASPELKAIRREYSIKNGQIKTKLDKIIASTNNKEILQDEIITVRDGRYVIPVKKEHRDKFPGLIHDQSNTGSTLFIEPQVIVNLNNELRELEIQEKAEIERILMELSQAVAEYYYQIKNNQELLTNLDFIMAKAKFSLDMKGEEPDVNENKVMFLKEARHPLISSDKIVPITVSIGGETGDENAPKHRSLIITGPNTGGKTVTLKTIGLLTLMVQTGLHIPAAGTSKMPIFEEVFADIGDEQSIEQNLSTFSSHMKNIVEITGKADEDTLVLLDELGAGTDPDEGAALAIAILETLYNKGAITVATTHYNELKKYALQTPGAMNASMEFDLATLSPTFKLRVGIPGRSNAFEISKKLGLVEEIISRAEELLKGEEMKFENVLEAIEQNERQTEKEKTEAEELKQFVKKRADEIESREKKLEKQREKIIEEAKETARQIIKEAEETTKEVKEELRELSHIDSLGKRNEKFDQSRKKLTQAKAKVQEEVIQEVNDKPVSVKDLKIGDRVKMTTINQNGEIISLPNEKGELQIQIGNIKVNAKLKDLILIENDSVNRKKKTTKSSYGSMLRSKAQNVAQSINVRGMNLEEANFAVDKYLDDAYMSGLEMVTIVHGKGEGILSSGIRQNLKKNSRVSSFKRGAISEGGEGVTVVKLKK